MPLYRKLQLALFSLSNCIALLGRYLLTLNYYSYILVQHATSQSAQCVLDTMLKP